MASNSIQRFYLGIVIPSIVAIILNFVAIYALIIPSFEKQMMERKKEMISELTNTAWSLMDEYNNEYADSVYSLQEAQSLAATKIGKLRYGEDQKDYFWITDMQPIMVMHPYRKELIGTDLVDYKDPNGKKLFVEAVNIIKKQDEGYINYIWQWKDDSSRIVPKLSYVKSFPEWNWIIGTGIYLEDVKEEIKSIEKNLIRISIIILLIISVLLLYIIRQSLQIERRRKSAEDNLKLSRQKYRSLVEASVDGTLMIRDSEIIFSNYRFNEMLGVSSMDALKLSFDDIFEIGFEEVMKMFQKPGKSITIETKLKCVDKPDEDVVITITKIQYAGQDGFIIITKSISKQRQVEIDTQNLSEEVQTSLLLMNQPIKPYIKDYISCDINSTIEDCSALLERKKQKIILVTSSLKPIGVVNTSDIINRSLAKKLDPQNAVSEIMTSPIVYIDENALLYETILQFSQKNITHLAVKNSKNEFIGFLSKMDILELNQNTLSFLVKEVEIAENVEQIRRIYEKVPVLIKALLDSGAKTQNIFRITTSLADAITIKLINFAIEKTGSPPCRFAFMALGSEGRMTQTLATDQDNAIIFEDISNDLIPATTEYFLRIAEDINNNLHTIGYKFCEGEVMAKNPKWTQPLATWKAYFDGWLNTSDPQSILDASIFFDFRCVYGDENLTKELRESINSSIDTKSVFLFHMAQSIVKIKLPLGTFGGIVSEAGKDKIIDVKKILLPVTGFIKIYSLKSKLFETNSIQRLEKLVALGIIHQDSLVEISHLYNYLMQLRLRFQSQAIQNNITPNNEVDLSKLSNVEISTLKKIFTVISRLQSKLSVDFKGSS